MRGFSAELTGDPLTENSGLLSSVRSGTFLFRLRDHIVRWEEPFDPSHLRRTTKCLTICSECHSRNEKPRTRG